MKNPFCISKDDLIQIFWGQSTDKKISDILKKFGKQYSLLKICQQMENRQGEVGEYFSKELERFSKKSTHEEIAHAITLADFYFLKSKPVICFEMKRAFKKNQVETFEELLENIENDTEIDCLLKDSHAEFHFQLKQYPEKYKEWSAYKVLEYIKEAILSKNKYNNESNHDLIIIIAIKPEPESRFKELEDFKVIHNYLCSESIKLREINFLYNRNNEFMVWYQVYPRSGHYKIPWEKLSYHQAKKRNKNLYENHM